jgi:hypothetical protein
LLDACRYGGVLMADKTKRVKTKDPKKAKGAAAVDAEKPPTKPPAIDSQEARAARNRARERSGSED